MLSVQRFVKIGYVLALGSAVLVLSRPAPVQAQRTLAYPFLPGQGALILARTQLLSSAATPLVSYTQVRGMLNQAMSPLDPFGVGFSGGVTNGVLGGGLGAGGGVRGMMGMGGAMGIGGGAFGMVGALGMGGGLGGMRGMGGGFGGGFNGMGGFGGFNGMGGFGGFGGMGGFAGKGFGGFNGKKPL